MNSKDTILVVEDEALIAMNLEDAFTVAGFEVQSFAAGEAARDYLQHTRDNVVGLSCDNNLAGQMTGIEFCEQARAILPNLKILMVSASAQRQNGFEVIEKPVIPQKVVSRMLELVRGLNA